MSDVHSMDEQLTFPNPRLPTELLPLQDLCADLVGDSESTPIIISNPLNHDSIPDTHAARVALHGLRRACQALSSPFNTLDAVLPCETWLKFAFELLATIHKGLHNAQLASPDLQSPDAFHDLTIVERGLSARLAEASGWILDFFSEEDEDHPVTHTHCLHCVQSVDLPTPPNLATVAALSTMFDARVYRETLLNQ